MTQTSAQIWPYEDEEAQRRRQDELGKLGPKRRIGYFLICFFSKKKKRVPGRAPLWQMRLAHSGTSTVKLSHLTLGTVLALQPSEQGDERH